jgi:hypothetical protein
MTRDDWSIALSPLQGSRVNLFEYGLAVRGRGGRLSVSNQRLTLHRTKILKGNLQTLAIRILFHVFLDTQG